MSSTIEDECIGWLTKQELLLWRYATYQDLASATTTGRYCGPGIFQDEKQIFLRLEPDSLEVTDELHRVNPRSDKQHNDWNASISIDDAKESIRFISGETLLSLGNCAHVEIRDIDFHGGTFACIDVTEMSHDICLQGCGVRFSLYGLLIQEDCRDITVAACQFDNGFPDTARWGDIKNGDPPPLEAFNSSALCILDSRRVKIEGNSFVRCFQAMNLDGLNLLIKNNKFVRPHEAILIAPSTTAEVSGNVILHALEAFSLVGGTNKRKPGRIEIHHNVVDLSQVRYVERKGNFGEFNRERTTGWDLMGSHDCDPSCNQAVFYIYNNTLIGGGSSSETGWNADGTPLRSQYKKHFEYNNIYISLGESSLERSVGTSAGNILWQNGRELQTQEPHSLVIDPGIDLSKSLQLNANSASIEELRRCYLPTNEAAFTPGASHDAIKASAYRGAVTK